VESWEARVGEAAVDGPRDFTVTLPDDEEDFRRRVAAVLDQAAALSNPHKSPMGDNDMVATGPRRTLLAENGLVAPSWPRPWGLDANPLQQLIVQEEFDRRGLEQPSMAIGQWVLPVVLKHGTPEQIELLAAASLRGELIWCQLFSEPEAGSDVASLTLRATKTDGGWLLNGQKIWTTQAHLADWGLCLARTGNEESKHRGLSMFLTDMTSPQLNVRPIKQANSEADFNEVFFNDAFVPDAMCWVNRARAGRSPSTPSRRNACSSAPTVTPATKPASAGSSPLGNTPAHATTRCARWAASAPAGRRSRR
jgi:alkylation response protein AidB-like acyl-CoA dehydrogenase